MDIDLTHDEIVEALSYVTLATARRDPRPGAEPREFVSLNPYMALQIAAKLEEVSYRKQEAKR